MQNQHELELFGVHSRCPQVHDHVKIIVSLLFQFSFDRAAQVVLKRFSNPWMKIDWLFALTPLGREHAKCLNTLHTFADGVTQR